MDLLCVHNHCETAQSKSLRPVDITLVCQAKFPSGPGMTYQHLHADPAEDFPEMRYMPGVQEDFAAYLQCLVHMTHILSNAHDLLYSSKSFSIALAKAEHYYKHIDEFSESKRIGLGELIGCSATNTESALSVFRDRWRKKLWLTYPMNECVWISFVSAKLKGSLLYLIISHIASSPPVHLFLFPACIHAAGVLRQWQQ